MITLRLVSGTLLCFMIFAGCRKQIEPASTLPAEPFVTLALDHLRQNLPESEFRSLSTDGYVYLKKSSGGLDLVRFFVKGDASRSVTVSQNGIKITSSWFDMKDRQIQSAANQFKLSGITDGRSREITIADGHVAEIVSGSKKDKTVISIRQSEDRQIISETLPNGKLNPESTQWLPEFTVTAQVGGLDRTFYSLFWLTGMDPAYLYAYTNINPYEPIDEGGAANSAGEPSPPLGNEIEIVPEWEFENAEAIDLAKALKCFDNISNTGARYSMSLYVDIPVNNDPTELAKGVTPGHSFISMTKSNGSSTMTQVFGFYPAVGILSVFNSAIKSRIHDNSEHEYDAAITIDSLDEYSFNAAKYLASYLANGMMYDLNDFNCTDFAMEIFNKAMPLDDQLVVQDWHTNVLNINYGTTPNALYQELSSRGSGGKATISVGTASAKATSGGCQ